MLRSSGALRPFPISLASMPNVRWFAKGLAHSARARGRPAALVDSPGSVSGLGLIWFGRRNMASLACFRSPASARGRRHSQERLGRPSAGSPTGAPFVDVGVPPWCIPYISVLAARAVGQPHHTIFMVRLGTHCASTVCRLECTLGLGFQRAGRARRDPSVSPA